MFEQILALENEVEDPDDDSQWDSPRISSALIGLAMESWTECCVYSGMVTVAGYVNTVV